MRAGRYPEGHALEILARAQQRKPSPQSLAAKEAVRTKSDVPPPKPIERPAPKRWM